MFTGIVEEVGTIKNIKRGANSAVLEIAAETVTGDLKLGDSVAVNGVCLTVVSFDSRKFCADVMHETLDRSSLAALRPGSHVNLERAMPANGRYGGHLVSGHVNGLGKIASIKKDDIAIRYTISAGADITKYIVEKGSIAIDGISLTVTGVDEGSFSVSIIPHTAKSTVLYEKKIGDIVNLETDIIAKYVEKLLGFAPLSSPGDSSGKARGGAPKKESGVLTREFLLENGF
ncbi:MAG: riboflavin synthase [Bacillota bacterium]|nr:riboflavin synthase [Bacillota bacterium]